MEKLANVIPTIPNTPTHSKSTCRVLEIWQQYNKGYMVEN